MKMEPKGLQDVNGAKKFYFYESERLSESERLKAALAKINVF